MKKIISAVLTVTMILGSSSMAFAQPKQKVNNRPSTSLTQQTDAKTSATLSTSTSKKPETKKNETKAEVKGSSAKAQPQVHGKSETKKNNQLANVQAVLLKKVDDMISQVNKLKGYIVSSDGKFLVEFKDQATGDAVLKSIDDAIAKLNDFKARINAATTSQAIKSLSKELQNNWMKHQTIMKRITGLTSAARLKQAYDNTKTLLDKLGAGLDGITGSSITLDVTSFKAQQQQIAADLEVAHSDYLQAVAMFSSISDTNKSDKSFKDAQAQLMKAKKELQQCLVKIKQLVEKIKESFSGQADVNKPEDEDNDENGTTIPATPAPTPAPTTEPTTTTTDSGITTTTDSAINTTTGVTSGT